MAAPAEQEYPRHNAERKADGDHIPAQEQRIGAANVQRAVVLTVTTGSRALWLVRSNGCRQHHLRGDVFNWDIALVT